MLMRKTKIICTLGPACRDKNTLTKMVESGMNVARLNFSHQDHKFHEENIRTLKEIRKELAVPLALLLDTKGPEIRTGMLEKGFAELKEGEYFTLTARQISGDESGCSVSCRELPQYLKNGDKVLIDDGKIALCVKELTDTDIKCLITSGGTLGNTRGINIPDVQIDTPFLSEKDRTDISFGVECGINIIAASFVRTADDIMSLRAFLSKCGGEDIKIIAKIESRQGIENFDSILAVSDGIMIARGDMGVEIPFEELPGIQKKLIAKCYLAGKPAVTATQMLESMIENPNPTRAEISDVANAVFDSSSAVMLSGETAIGKDPAAVVAAMAKICETAENEALELGVYGRLGSPAAIGGDTDAVCEAAAVAAAKLDADAIIAVTKNGGTAKAVAKYRPRATLIGATDNIKVFHQLSLNWGVKPVLTEPQPNTDALFSHATEAAMRAGFLCPGGKAVITAGSPVGVSGTTNTLKIVRV